MMVIKLIIYFLFQPCFHPFLCIGHMDQILAVIDCLKRRPSLHCNLSVRGSMDKLQCIVCKHHIWQVRQLQVSSEAETIYTIYWSSQKKKFQIWHCDRHSSQDAALLSAHWDGNDDGNRLTNEKKKQNFSYEMIKLYIQSYINLVINIKVIVKAS